MKPRLVTFAGLLAVALAMPALAQKKYDAGASDKEIKIGGIDTASAKVASARYNPSSLSAGRPKRNPTSRHTAAAIGIVAQ